MITYTLSHPQLSHPIEVDSTVERQPNGLIAWATMYILKEHDVLVDRDWWEVAVTP